MARFNPYQNSQIADSISGIARALIGSADTDAALARGRASDASARYKDSQTKYQNQLSDYLGVNTSAINDVLGDGNLVRQMFEATGLKSNVGQSIPDGSVGDMIAPNDVTPAVTDGMRGLVRSMFGGVPGNPQQSSAMAQTLADMVNQQEAYRLLSQSAQSPDRQAAIRLGQMPGKYFDEGFANRELADTLLNNLQKQELVNTGNLAKQGLINENALAIQELMEAGEVTQTELQNTSEEKRATADREAESAWKTEIEETKIEIANIDDKRKRQIELDKLEQSQSEQIDKQYIVADGIITMSPALAKKMGVETTTETNNGSKVFAINVRPGEGKTPVLLGGGGDDAITIYVDSANLDKLNVQNIGGKPVIPEGALANPAKKSGSQKDPAYENLTSEEAKTIKGEANDRIAAVFTEDLPKQVQLGLIDYVVTEVNLAAGKGEKYGQATTDILGPLTSQGSMLLGGYYGTKVPVYFHNRWMSLKPKMKLDEFKKAVIKMASEVGYTAPEIEQIFQDSRYN